MKIFDWVHRRFTHHKAGLAENAKTTSGGEEQNTLLGNTLLEAVDGWKGGVLTIGTFGYDSFRGDENNEQDIDHDDDEYLFYKQESDEDEINGDDEANPLVAYAANYNARDYQGIGLMEEGNRAEFEDMSPKKERKTLAELFYADSSARQLVQAIERREDVKNKHANKLIGEDARPIRKIHRLMRRMFKRKIHPAADLPPNKQNPPINDDSEIVVKNRGSASDAVV